MYNEVVKYGKGADLKTLICGMVKTMKSTGIVRKVDELGRVVIPKELRNTLGIAERDPLEIYVEGSRIILQKYETSCVFCSERTDEMFMGKYVCEECREKLADTIDD